MAAKKKTGPKPKLQPDRLRHEVADHTQGTAGIEARRAVAGDPQSIPGRGKRKKGELAIDWRILEREYITGTIEEDPKSGHLRRRYPSIRDLAKRHSLGVPIVTYHCRKGNWLPRREKFVLQMREELEEELAKARGVDAGVVVSMLNTFIRKFGIAIKEDAIARGTINDLERALRLRHWVKQESDALNQPQTTLSLDALQARHREFREQAQALDPALSGSISGRTEREAAAMQERKGSAIAQAGEDPLPAEPIDSPAPAPAAPAAPAPPREKAEPKPKPLSAARLAAQAARRRAGLPEQPGHATGPENRRKGQERKAKAEAWERVAELAAC